MNCVSAVAAGSYNYLYDLSAASGTSYPVGLVQSCPTSGSTMTLTSAPSPAVLSGDSLVVVTPIKPGDYVWISSGAQVDEARQVVGSAGPVNQIVVE